MIVEKKLSKQYEVGLWPADARSTPMSELIAYRKAKGLMSTRQLERCFCCGHVFGAEEIPRIGSVAGVGNRFFCSACTAKEKENG